MFLLIFNDFNSFTMRRGAERCGYAHKGLHKLIIAMSGSFDVVLDGGK